MSDGGTYARFQKLRDVVEVFGMDGSFTEANQGHTMIAQDPTVFFPDIALGRDNNGQGNSGLAA